MSPAPSLSFARARENGHMRLVFLSTIFPNPYQPTRGTFNLALARALAAGHDVRVVCPVAWTDEWAGRRKHGRLLDAGRVDSAFIARHTRFGSASRISMRESAVCARGAREPAPTAAAVRRNCRLLGMMHCIVLRYLWRVCQP